MFWLTVSNPLLRCIDVLTSGDWGASRRIFRGLTQEEIDARVKHFASLLDVFARSFDLGTISCERLIEVLVPPFLKLGGRFIEVPSEGMTKTLFVGWSSALIPHLATIIHMTARAEKRVSLCFSLGSAASW